MIKQGVLSGTLPIGYCSKCIDSFTEGVKPDKQDYVISQQLPGRKAHCSKCRERARLFYPVKLRKGTA